MSSPIILITGATRGIGLEVGRQLLERGAAVFLTGRDAAAGEAAVSLNNPQAFFLSLDVADAGSIQQVAAELGRRVDHLDVLINNAGILDLQRDQDRSVGDLPAEVMERTWRTNTLAPVLVTQAMLPLLRKSAAGRVINVSSGGGSLTDLSTFAPAYCISKAALNMATLQFAAALKDEKIAVNAVCPGWVRTRMGGAAAPRSVEEGANGIVWLALDAPQELTGKFLRDRAEIAW